MEATKRMKSFPKRSEPTNYLLRENSQSKGQECVIEVGYLEEKKLNILESMYYFLTFGTRITLFCRILI